MEIILTKEKLSSAANCSSDQGFSITRPLGDWFAGRSQLALENMFPGY
jgi:hypothetical protein